MNSPWLTFESIKDLVNKTSMLHNLDFANNTTLSCFFNYWLILFNSCSYCTNFNPTAELVIPIGIPTKESNEMEEMETHPVTIEITIGKWSI